MHIPHSLAQIQSASLPETTDVAIIGSGITGTSVAKFLLEGRPDTHVTILEARTLCSGATGRNGGHLVTFGGAGYSALKAQHGADEAAKILKFAQDTCDQLLETAKEMARDESEIRPVTRVRAFGDAESLEEVKRSVAAYELDHPAMRGRFEFIDGKQALEVQRFGNHHVAGAALFPAAALWPYRFVLKVIEHLRNIYSARLSIEANTPVTDVQYLPDLRVSHPYALRTPRGNIYARQVVYCTNGYTSHLLPELRGRLFPKRATMTVQDLIGLAPNRGDSTSWNLHQKARYDPNIDAILNGSYYLQQNANSGFFFFGGEAQIAHTALTSDDTNASAVSVQHLVDKLSEFFGIEHENNDALVSSWSGIMGFTPDSLPLAGKLPSSITLRDGDGEWIAAGFNGGGMCLCWRVGEAIAKQITVETCPIGFLRPSLCPRCA
ncbi:FAD dependent oxidoreductase [Tothia fuscella]|uniref:FAD dependent oxidoreductase n=1 Tax=Tothia fuscella TaxID=1048955 RepID=A0A9P4TTM4_9PEZI|nr:FAD dependent oxidoreductase [Tothia fuscella]